MTARAIGSSAFARLAIAMVIGLAVLAAACAREVTPRAGHQGRTSSTASTRSESRPAPPGSTTQPAPTAVAPAQGGGPGAASGQRQGRLAGKRICVDPGHDAFWGVGATGRDRQGHVPVHPTEGIPLFEYELTLKVAYRLSGLLERESADVCVTRRADGSLQIQPYDFTGDGQVRPDGVAVEDGPERTQPRIDWANQFGAEILVSIHFNGLDDPTVRGTEVYYSDVGPQAEQGRALAEALLEALSNAMGASGYPAVSRGVRSDRYERYPPEDQAAFLQNNASTIRRNGFDPDNCPDCQRIGVLGNNPMSLHRGTYIGALVEVEFLSNPNVVEDFLMRPDALDIIATGLANGVLAYFHAV